MKLNGKPEIQLLVANYHSMDFSCAEKSLNNGITQQNVKKRYEWTQTERRKVSMFTETKPKVEHSK